MDTLKQKFHQQLARIDALALRERVLLLIGLLFIIYFVWNGLLMSPLASAQKQFTTQNLALREQIVLVEQQIQTIKAGGSVDPNSETRARLVTLKSEIAEVDQQLVQVMGGLIDPTQMVEVLKEVLQRNTELKLIRIENKGSSSLAPTPAEAPEQTPATRLFKHVLVIEFQGSYLSTLRYLQALESLPWKIFWDSVEFKVDEHPQAQVTITIHTLSVKEGWMGV